MVGKERDRAVGKDPAMPLYVNDWLSSPRVQSMTVAQELAYFRLCAFCWASGDASIPDDDEQLAALSRMGEGWLKGGSTVVRKCFNQHPTKAGFLTNQKLYELWQERQHWREKSRIGGQNSAASRGRKRSYKRVKGGSTVVQPPYEPNGNSSSSSSSSSLGVSKGVHVPGQFDTPDVRAAIDRWAGYYHEKRGEFFNAFMLEALYADSMRKQWSAADLIRNITGSIRNGWAGVREFRDDDPTPANGRASPPPTGKPLPFFNPPRS